MNKKITFALYFANRGFFPGEYISSARDEIKSAVKKAGFDFICMDEDKTRYGAVETIDEGKLYADFLRQNKGKYDGVIVSLPNFGDENGMAAALKNADVPLLIQAYPDEIGSMDFAHRRDAMCGKFAICNILRQCKIPYTLTKDFVVSPASEAFDNDLKDFAAVCRIVKGMKSFNIGSIGARTTAFKTVRIDEIALQNVSINLETIDLSEVFARIEQVSVAAMEKKKQEVLAITEFSGYPEKKLDTIAKLQVVLENIISEYHLDAIAIRCWSEFQTVLGIAPCTNLCILNEKGIVAACEVDISNAIMMRALSLASNGACTLLDFNNNYDIDKAILFHCGPVPISMLKGKGKMMEHLMFKKSYGEGSGVGINKGELLSGAVTFGSIKTENGKLDSFVSEGEFTDDPIEAEFFGIGKVLKNKDINDIANFMAKNGYKHHLAVTFGNVRYAINEAFSNYLGYGNKIL